MQTGMHTYYTLLLCMPRHNLTLAALMLPLSRLQGLPQELTLEQAQSAACKPLVADKGLGGGWGIRGVFCPGVRSSRAALMRC